MAEGHELVVLSGIWLQDRIHLAFLFLCDRFSYKAFAGRLGSSFATKSIVAAFALASSVSFSPPSIAKPPGPRASRPGEHEFFVSLYPNLKVPRPIPNSAAILIAELDGKPDVDVYSKNEIIWPVSEAHSNKETPCCGIADCRYVQAEDLDDGYYKVYLGEHFKNSTKREIIVGPDTLVPGIYTQGFLPRSAVLCAAPMGNLSEYPWLVYCFNPGQVLSFNGPGNWVMKYAEREIEDDVFHAQFTFIPDPKRNSALPATGTYRANAGVHSFPGCTTLSLACR